MTGGTIKLYITTMTSSTELRKQQQHIIDILQSHKIDFETIDITDSANGEQKQFMRDNSVPLQEGKIPLPPQVFNEDQYCGNYERFTESIEDDELFEFFKLAVKKEVSQAAVTITGGRPSDDFDQGQQEQEKEENGDGDADCQ